MPDNPPLVLDLVLETANNPGTGAFILAGAPVGRRTFAAAASNGSRVCYYADDGTQAEWGIATLNTGSPAVLNRQIVTGNTAGNTSPLNFTGAVRVYSEVPAAYVAVLDQNGGLALRGDLSAQNGSFRSFLLSGTSTVPDVTDWSSQSIVSARSVNKRFVRNNAGTKGGVIAIDQLSDGSGILSYLDADNKWHACAPNGDYATNSDLRSARDTANSALNDARGRVSRAGDTMTGDLHVVPDRGVYTNHLVPQTENGSIIVDNGGILLNRPPDGGESGALVPTCGWVLDRLPIDRGKKIIEFQVANAADGARINFPSSFSGKPTIQLTTELSSYGSELIPANASAVDSGGFRLSTWSGRTIPTLHVTATGPR